MLIRSATGTVMAQGSAVALSAQAMRLALTKPHPVFLVAAGSVLAFATLAALAKHLAHMTGDRNASLPGPAHTAPDPNAPAPPPTRRTGMCRTGM